MARPKLYQTEEEKRQAKALHQKEYRQRKSRSLRNAAALSKQKDLFQIDRPAVRYYGSKFRIASWIIDQFPAHTCYVEPFAGGASVLLQKEPSQFEVLNDINQDVINFFDVLRGDTEKLIRAILLTPYARAELKRSQEPADDPLERARRFYIRAWQSFGSGTGTTKSATGWRYQIGRGDSGRANAVDSWNDTEHLWMVAERLKLVQIECDDASKVIQRFDGTDTLFYLDYPYLHSTRYVNAKYKGYSHEMTDDDHRRYAELVRQLKGMVIVSGYHSELYDELYVGWKLVTKETRDVLGKKQVECLWLSPRVTEINSLPLFKGIG